MDAQIAFVVEFIKNKGAFLHIHSSAVATEPLLSVAEYCFPVLTGRRFLLPPSSWQKAPVAVSAFLWCTASLLAQGLKQHSQKLGDVNVLWYLSCGGCCLFAEVLEAETA